MRYLVLIGFCLLAAFAILAFSCQKPVKQITKAGDIGVIWNYSNASSGSTGKTFGLPTTRTDGALYSDPSTAAATYLADATLCKSTDWGIAYTPSLHDRYIKPCAECHCDPSGAPWNAAPHYAAGGYHVCISNQGGHVLWEKATSADWVRHRVNPGGIPNDFKGWYPWQWP